MITLTQKWLSVQYGWFCHGWSHIINVQCHVTLFLLDNNRLNYVSLCECVSICLCVCVSGCVYLYLRVCQCVCLHVCVCMCACIWSNVGNNRIAVLSEYKQSIPSQVSFSVVGADA